jgi:Mn-containing catalase
MPRPLSCGAPASAFDRFPVDEAGSCRTATDADLIASIAAEEFAHIELVSTAINTMLTGAAKGKAGKKGSLKGIKDVRNSQEFLAGGAAAMVQDSMGKPWNGDYVAACTRSPTREPWRT